MFKLDVVNYISEKLEEGDEDFTRCKAMEKVRNELKNKISEDLFKKLDEKCREIVENEGKLEDYELFWKYAYNDRGEEVCFSWMLRRKEVMEE